MLTLAALALAVSIVTDRVRHQNWFWQDESF